ncbi:Uncharacterised protein [uncultured Clostridium sp.]|uniref:hypothetical protein n=1 Tax=uncultured Clostridium sp. TaxID=59620 RepID=UPI000821D374|nr:hypothetical protein [uncultured Clostridium sp.]SCJ54539.1 Uncharacterised protein [uncultured Clostridium sp.]
MIKRKCIIYLIICLITLMQIYLYLKDDKEVIEVISINEIEERKSFEDIDKELNNIENLELLELKDNGESWSGKILLYGAKNEVINNIELLKDYNITNYKIDGNVNEFQVLLDICR